MFLVVCRYVPTLCRREFIRILEKKGIRLDTEVIFKRHDEFCVLDIFEKNIFVHFAFPR